MRSEGEISASNQTKVSDLIQNEWMMQFTMIRRNTVCQNTEIHQYLRNDLEKRAKDFEIINIESTICDVCSPWPPEQARREPRKNDI